MMIYLKDIVKQYETSVAKKVTAVSNFSLEVNKGDVLGLLGPNGSGKTTIIKTILGLVRPTSGEVKLLGQEPSDYRSREKVGYLPENAYFYSHLTGRELLEFAGSLFNMPKELIDKRIEELLVLVSMKGRDHIRMKGYSKGMLQRIGIAHALINNPDLILFDEPMSGLDPIGRYDVKNIILDLKKQGKTIFFCSHILSDVEAICTNISIIVDGVKVDQEEINKIMQKKTNLEEYFIELVKKIKYESSNNR